MQPEPGREHTERTEHIMAPYAWNRECLGAVTKDVTTHIGHSLTILVCWAGLIYILGFSESGCAT